LTPYLSFYENFLHIHEDLFSFLVIFSHKKHPTYLNINIFYDMVKSGAPFARKFSKDELVLDKINKDILGCSDGQFTPSGWCEWS
jgi:protein xylosyltransferase